MQIHPVFNDHMVLQAEKTVCIYGSGSSDVTVEIDGCAAVGRSDGENWLAVLPAHPYGGPYTLHVSDAQTALDFSDVWFGDVLLLAGQSNLQLKFFETNTPQTCCESEPLLRSFILRRPEEGEFYFPEDGWIPAQAETVGKWPALGYLAGRMHVRQSGHAVGVIGCYQGASMLQSWVPAGIFDGTPQEFVSEHVSGDTRVREYMLWNHDGFLYDRMFREVVPLAMRAVIWYQGESNADQAGNTCEDHCAMLRALIDCWRRDLRQPELPFLVIQLPDLRGSDPFGWPGIQSAQEKACAETPYTTLIRSADISENDHIHPPTKLPLARRIADALWEIEKTNETKENKS